jgi:hypothetical protein
MVAMDRLQKQLQGLVDADLVLPEDGQWLLAALEQALAGLTGQDRKAARAGIAAFVGRVESLIATGSLAAADGQPPLEAAAALAALL